MKHAIATVRVVPRPFELGAHVAGDDRHRAGVGAPGVFGVERDESLSEIEVVPRPRQQFTQPNASEIRGHEQRFEEVRQRVALLRILLVGEEALAGVLLADHREMRNRAHLRRRAFPPEVQRDPENRELAVAGRFSPPLGETFLAILLQCFRREPSDLQRPEVRPDVRLDTPLENLLGRGLLIGVRVFEYVVEEFSADRLERRRARQFAAGFPAEDLIAELFGFLKTLRKRRAHELLAIHVIRNVPDSPTLEDCADAVGSRFLFAGTLPPA